MWHGRVLMVLVVRKNAAAVDEMVKIVLAHL